MSTAKDGGTGRQSLLKRFAGVGAIRLAAIPLSLLGSVVLARVLGAEAFGQYAYMMALVAVLALPVSGGAPVLVTREAARYSQTGAWGSLRGLLRAGYLWVLGYALLTILLVLLISGWFDAASGRWSLLSVAVLLVPFLGLTNTLSGANKGLGFPLLAEAPLRLLQPAAFLGIIGLLVLAARLTPALALAAQALASGATYLLAVSVSRRRRSPALYRAVPEYAWRSWSRALLPITMISLVSTLNAQVGILLLGVLDTDASVAALRIAERGALLVGMSLGIVNIVIAPRIVGYALEDNRRALERLSRYSARAALAIATPIALVFLLGGRDLIGFVFGADYAAIAYGPLAILTLGQLVNVFFGSVGYLLTMSDREADTLWGQGVALVVTAAACGILIPGFGATGAAVGVTLGLLAWNVILAIRVGHRLGIRPTAF